MGGSLGKNPRKRIQCSSNKLLQNCNGEAPHTVSNACKIHSQRQEPFVALRVSPTPGGQGSSNERITAGARRGAAETERS